MRCVHTFISLALALATTSSATILPCLTDSSANKIATTFGTLVSNYKKDVADALLASSFIDYSESINSLKNNGCSTPNSLLGPALSSKADFETESAAQPPVPFTVKNVWHNCNTITVRWQSDQSPQPVVGISVLEVQPALFQRYGFQITRIFAEFDSAAWLVNLGIFKPVCS